MSNLSNLELAKQAIACLGSNPEADKWLTTFEVSTEAWEIANSLIDQPPEFSTYRFFGSKIMYSKVQNDLSQLSPESVQNLKLAIVTKIVNLSKEPSVDMVVCRYLCLALSSLACQLNEPGIFEQILLWLNSIVTSAPLVILEFLIVLPEECRNVRSRQNSDSFSSQLSSSALQVIGFLQSLVTPAISSESLNKLLKCLQSWIHHTCIPVVPLIQSTFYNLALDSLSNPETFQEAAEVIIVTIWRFFPEDDDDYEGPKKSEDERHEKRQNLNSVLEKTLPHIIASSTMWSGYASAFDDDNKHDEIGRPLVRLFSDAAEASMDFIVAGNLPYEEEILQQLLLCTTIPNDIASIPLNFFYKLQLMIVNDEDKFRQSANKARFGPRYMSLLGNALVKLKPSDDSLDESENASYRTDWMNAIEDCCKVLGGEECLRLICSTLRDGMSSISLAEACIIAVGAVCKDVPATEALCLPWLMNILPSLVSNERIRPSTVALVGKLTSYIRENPQYLLPLISLVQQNLHYANTSIAASKSMQELLYCSPASPELPLVSIHGRLLQLRSADGSAVGFPLKADLNILKGLSRALSKKEPQITCAGMQSLMEPIVKSLSVQLASNSAIGDRNSNVYFPNLDRLAVIFECTKYDESKVISGTHPTVELFLQIWPVLQNILSTAPLTSERVCRVYKYMVRSVELAFKPYIGAMCTHIVEQFQLLPNNALVAFIYLASIMFGVFGEDKDASLIQILHHLFDTITNSLFSKFPTLSHIEQCPDIIEEYFFLCSKILVSNPSIYFLSESSKSRTVQIVQMGLISAKINDGEVQKAVLNFFYEILSLVDPSSKQRKRMIKDGSAHVISCATELFPSFAPFLLLVLFQNLSGQVLRNLLRVNDDFGSIRIVITGVVDAAHVCGIDIQVMNKNYFYFTSLLYF